MLLLRSNDAARAELQTLRSTMGGLQRNSDSVARNYEDSSRDLQDADSDLRDADWPIRRAEQDTVNTDVSNEGWDIDRALDSCDRQLSSRDREIGEAVQTSRTVNSDVDSARGSFTRLRSLLADRPDLLPDLDRASNQLEGASRDHKSADSDSQQSDTQGDRAQRDLQSCDTYVWHIRNDRVGTDVSSDARFLESRVNNVNWDLRDSRTTSDRAGREERQANQGFQDCDQTLALLQNRL